MLWPPSSPPSHHVTWNHNNSYRTALTNACTKLGLSLRFEAEREPDTPSHNPRFSAVCYLNERVYGRATDSAKKSALTACARQALERLSEESPQRLVISRDYLPIFNAYVKEENLDDRISFTDTASGPAHQQTWTSILCLDGNVIGEGRAFTKNAAREAAAIEAAQAWGV